MTKARDLAGAANSAVNSTEIGYLDGVTSSVQTQLDAKIAKSLVDAKGDLVAATANDTPGVLTVGSNGETLVADSSATTGLRWTATPAASNPVINSGFDIWQRGTSDFTPLNASFVYTADRWSCFRSAGSSGALVKYVSSTGLAGIPNAARMQRTSGNTSTDSLYLLHNLETKDSTRFQGKTITLSFYARAGANFSGSNSNIAFFMYSGTGTDLGGFSSGWTGAAPIVDTTSATLTTSWVRYSATGTVSSSANQIGMVFYYAGVGTAGANDYFDITGVQIDVGNVALPYRRSSATLAGELAACRRYFLRQSLIANEPIYGGARTGNGGASDMQLAGVHPQGGNYRTAPSISFKAVGDLSVNDDGTLKAVTSLAPYVIGQYSCRYWPNISPNTLTANRFVLLEANTNTYVDYSAEL